MKPTIALLILPAVILSMTFGCSAQPPNEEEQAEQPPAVAVSHQKAINTASGTVIETMNAASYTYVRVDTGGEEIWVAAGQFEIAVGDHVTFPLETPMTNFHSDTLDRDFPLIYFVSSIRIEGEEALAEPAMPAGHPPIGGTTTASESTKPEPVEVAEGGKTIAELWSGKTDLSGSSVTFRGRVVKFNGGILGRNWLHLQDGSGDPNAGTHDITVTSDAAAMVGDVITITGTLVVDQDFGSGYTYAVLVENAKLEKN